MAEVVSEPAFEALRSAMAARVEQRRLPGMVLLVAREDDVRVAEIGTWAFDGGPPMRRDTVFRIASLTKPILAAATMTLIEDGTLSLDEPVDRVLPELADRRVLRHIDGPLDDIVPARRPITVADLLTLRMGFGMLVEPTFDPPFPIVTTANDLRLTLGAPDPRTPHDPDTWIRLFATLPLMYQPGERWLYNVGSLVLGVLIARAAGQPLPELFRTRVYEPLGMTHSGFSLPPGHDEGIPTQYLTNMTTGVMEEQALTRTEIWRRPPVFPSAAGGLLSTIDDYLAFTRMMLHDGQPMLSPASVGLLTTNQLSPDEITGGGVLLDGSGWSYGIGVVMEPDPRAGQYGWAGGSGTGWFNDPRRGLIAIALTQTSDFLFDGGLTEFRELASRC
jgi:CubicO group peptidase (beta-lactamase class C family)